MKLTLTMMTTQIHRLRTHTNVYLLLQCTNVDIDLTHLRMFICLVCSVYFSIKCESHLSYINYEWQDDATLCTVLAMRW